MLFMNVYAKGESHISSDGTKTAGKRAPRETTLENGNAAMKSAFAGMAPRNNGAKQFKGSLRPKTKKAPRNNGSKTLH